MTDRPVAVISGASGGIGKTIAQYFYVKGWDLVLLTGHEDTARALDEETKFWYHPAKSTPLASLPDTYILDVQLSIPIEDSDLLDVMEMAERCDVLVTCHGAAPCIKPTAELSEMEWWKVLSIDLTGTWRLCRAMLPFMLATGKGGSMSLMSSFHAVGTYPQRAAYAAAKAGVVGLMRALACEWAGIGIRVNALCPGQVEGERTRKIIESGEGSIYQDMQKRSPSGKLVEASDIARTVDWLHETVSMNGQLIVIDHGVTASLWHQPYPTQDEMHGTGVGRLGN